MRLKQILIIAFVLIAAVPLFAGLQFLNLRMSAEHRSYVEEYLSSLSLIAKQRVEASVNRVEDVTDLVASRAHLRLSLDAWNKTGIPSHRAQVKRVLADALTASKSIGSISVYDLKGDLVAATSPIQGSSQVEPAFAVPRTLNPYDLSERKFILEKNGAEVVAVNTVRLALEEGTIGFLRMEFSARFLTELTRSRTGLGTTGEWLVAVRDDKGNAVFAVPLKYDPKAAFQRKIPQDRTDVPITQALLGNEIIMSNAPDYLGVRVLASTRYLPKLDWGLVAKINESEVNAMVNANQVYIYMAEGFIILLSVGIGVFLSIYIARPVERLKKHTEKVAEGDFEEPPKAGGWYEISELSDHFSSMMRAIKELNTGLNETVERRTEELKEANEQLQKVAVLDPLTELYNRRFFNARLEEEISRAARYDHPMVVAILDIDHFKKVNDTYGHKAGDDVLVKVSAFMKSTLRKSDILARLGGEEFCMILPETDLRSAKVFLERLREAIACMTFEGRDRTYSVTCSIGTASLDKDEATPGDIMQKADQALYLAKDRGRNCLVEFDQRIVEPRSYPKVVHQGL